MDDIYQTYVNRVARMTLPDAYQSQVQHIQASPKYQPQHEGTLQATPFPGYSVITPPWADDPENNQLYETLNAFQQNMGLALTDGLVALVPPESFHMTIADLIWDNAYRHAVEQADFEPQLRDRMTQSFQRSAALLKHDEPILWQVLGLIVMTRAIAVCLAPRNEVSYTQITNLRRAIYQNPDLIALGIEQQYHFTAHITLGYFADVSVMTDPMALISTLNQLNEFWLSAKSPQDLWIHRAELRKFDDMTHYYREADWPALQFSASA